MQVAFLFIILFVLIFMGVPIGFAIGGASIATIYLYTNLDMIITAQYSFSGINTLSLVAIPFFMLAGGIMSSGGIAKRIVNFAQSLVGLVTGGLGAVAVIACAFFGALSGSGMATTSAVGSMMIPEMSRKGYDRAYAATLVCFGGVIGPIIPPSIAFITYGVITNTNISDLFKAGILPGIAIAIFLIIANYFLCKKYGYGLVTAEEKAAAAEMTLRQAMKHRLALVGHSIKDGFWALLTPVIILGGIYAGIFTPTEAACVSVVYSLIISMFVYKEMKWKDIYHTFVDTAVLNGITSFLLSYSTVFSTYLSFEEIPAQVFDLIMNVTSSKVAFILLVNVIMLIIGCFVDMIPAMIIMVPMLLPAALEYGFDPVHFGIIMCVNLAIGLCSPPYGCNLFVGAAVAKIKMEQLMKYIVPLFIVICMALMVIVFVPHLSLLFL